MSELICAANTTEGRQMTDTPDLLSDQEAAELDQCEAVIREGFTAALSVATALRSIQEKRLHRATHVSFEVYAWERWGLKKQHAWMLVYSGRVYEDLKPHCPVLPENEGQVRVLKRVPDSERAAVWNEAVRTAGRRVTARHVESVVKQRDLGYTGERRPATVGLSRLTQALETFARRVAKQAEVLVPSGKVGAVINLQPSAEFWVKLRNPDHGVKDGPVRRAKAFAGTIAAGGAARWRVQFEDATSVPLDQVERFATDAEIERARR